MKRDRGSFDWSVVQSPTTTNAPTERNDCNFHDNSKPDSGDNWFNAPNFDTYQTDDSFSMSSGSSTVATASSINTLSQSFASGNNIGNNVLYDYHSSSGHTNAVQTNIDNSNHNSSCYPSFGNATSINATSGNVNTVHLSTAEDDHADLLANIISDTLTENGLDIGQNMPQQLEPALQYVR